MNAFVNFVGLAAGLVVINALAVGAQASVRDPDDTRVYPADGPPITVASRPFQACRVAFPPHEHITYASPSDGRWGVTVAAAGAGGGQVAVLVIRPKSEDDLPPSNLEVMTDGEPGKYDLRLVVQRDAPFPCDVRYAPRHPTPASAALAFVQTPHAVATPAPAPSPAATLIAGAPCARRSATRYAVAPSTEDYRPTDVYDDGLNACIVLPPPSGIKSFPLVHAVIAGHVRKPPWELQGRTLVVNELAPEYILFAGGSQVDVRVATP